MLGEVINLSGPPGAGKSTVARLLAEYAEPSVHLDGDLLMLSIRRGFVLPWLAGSGQQNRTVITAIASAAASFARAGYFVVVDALIGPGFWMFSDLLSTPVTCGCTTSSCDRTSTWLSSAISLAPDTL